MIRSLVVTAWVIGLGVGAVASRGPEAAPRNVSDYAPVGDVVGQIDFFLERLAEDLEDEDAYGEEQQERLQKDANTVAVLALVLGLHDDDHPRKKSAPGLLEAAQKLAPAANDYSAAKRGYEALVKAKESQAETGNLKWRMVADIGQLMKQVPIVNNDLRRGVSGKRFAQSVEKNAGAAATLAAIAQVSQFDTSYCSGADDEAKWAKISAEMRDAAAGVNAAVRQGDQPAAQVALANLVKTCDACHESFRD